MLRPPEKEKVIAQAYRTPCVEGNELPLPGFLVVGKWSPIRTELDLDSFCRGLGMGGLRWVSHTRCPIKNWVENWVRRETRRERFPSAGPNECQFRVADRSIERCRRHPRDLPL